MIKTKKQMFVVIGVFALVMLLGTVTYAFFNYTRTGSANVVRTGQINFSTTQSSGQNGSINLTNVFPIDVTNGIPNNNSNVGEVTINVTGSTEYTGGIEYLVTATNVTNTVNGKSVPISIAVTATSGLGTSDDDYFTDRGSTTSYYKVLASDTISNNNQLLVGYIAPGQVGVNGNVVIKAYLDADKVAISDTYPGGVVRTVKTTNYSSNDCETVLDGVTNASTYCATAEDLQDAIDNEDLTEAQINLLVTNGIVEEYTNGTTTEWVDNRTVLTTAEWNQLQSSGVSFQVKVEANENIWVEEKLTGSEKILRAINTKEADTNVQCSNITYEEDGITYLSGTNDCVDMNYVWYSGKLWRITAIYPDGSMKLVTEDMITSIFWGSSVEYDGSWVYQWLNEDFYDTLVNPNNVIDSSTWNYSEDGNSTPVRPETIGTQKTKIAPVGLLNAYEYYNSYRCIGSAACTGSSYGTGYLNINYYWWLITPYSASYERYVYYTGSLNYYSPSSAAYGIRPSINLKSGLEFTGEGSKTSPYKIVGDKEDAVNNTTLLSSRSVGEYVKFDNDLYRIVDTNEGITKLTRVDYLRDSGTVITKNFASTVYFGKSTNTGEDTYWDYYLNNTWYDSISTTYKNMLVDGTYYLGLYPSSTNYKQTICKDADLNSVTTTNCTKYTSSDTDKTWAGKVGLPRVGEMFSSQLGSGYSTSSIMWTITPYSTSYVRIVNSHGNFGLLNYSSPSSNAYGVRPSITLKSGIKITGGTGYVGGDTNSPFEISE